MSVFKKLLFLGIVVVTSADVWGQAASSPFTNFGIGDPYGNSLIHNQGVAGTGVAQPQFWYINNQNPALLVFNSLTSFEAGMVYEQRKIKSAELSEKSTGGNMSYLVTAFPIKTNRWTTSVGLMPYTNVDFSFQYDTTFVDDDNRKAYYSESASGGLTQLYWSNGVRINKEMSVGLRASYIFGPIENIYSDQLDRTPTVVTREEKTSVSDFNFGVGYSFSRDSLWGKNYRFSAGVVYNLGTSLKAKMKDRFYAVNAAGDTSDIYPLSSTRGNIDIPSSITVGLALSRGLKWSIATEFMYQDWSDFKSVNTDDEGLGKSWRVALGGEITPDPVALGSYLKRITYRGGLSLEQYPFLPNGKAVKDYGASVGMSLPAGRSNVNIAFKMGRRGDRAQNILEESYVKIYFGITFNDTWFIKRKFD
ncbi:outer membrane protein transport protein [Parachryseolinea silvisoli]|uniref:outer membrane protein transport protein n=1 Tax=Parachryseolinea silvisoli TaxID=2873601 RepID=UPI002265CEA5|nr:outer membrane protein transport protein [Parachryseolinea silvisoli]MCD9016971.1 outer membrane protein transport protein [Parachryseolinea silvisoli]